MNQLEKTLRRLKIAIFFCAGLIWTYVVAETADDIRSTNEMVYNQREEFRSQTKQLEALIDRLRQEVKVVYNVCTPTTPAELPPPVQIY